MAGTRLFISRKCIYKNEWRNWKGSGRQWGKEAGAPGVSPAVVNSSEAGNATSSLYAGQITQLWNGVTHDKCLLNTWEAMRSKIRGGVFSEWGRTEFCKLNGVPGFAWTWTRWGSRRCPRLWEVVSSFNKIFNNEIAQPVKRLLGQASGKPGLMMCAYNTALWGGGRRSPVPNHNSFQVMMFCFLVSGNSIWRTTRPTSL